MKIRIQGGKQRITLATIILLSGWMSVSSSLADGLASDYVSYPPLINTSASGDKPNILLMLDTSGSMNDNVNGNIAGSNHETSRAIIAKKAVATIMDKYSVVANMGLMGFQPAPNFDYNRVCENNEPQCKWVGQNVGNTSSYAIRRGYLYIPMGSVNPQDTDADSVRRRNDFRRRLGLDVVRQTPDVFGRYPMFTFSASTYKSSTDYTTNRRIVSDGGTPLEGTYMSALEYYNGSLSASYKDPQLSNYTSTNWSTTGQCSVQNFAIMITDGMPSVRANGQACSGDCGQTTYTSYMNAVRTQAAALAAAGVQSYVIGFAVGNETWKKGLLDALAVSGGATTTAFLANNLSELELALDDIFGDIVERASSGTGAAVVTNRGNGLSADFQALYTPKKTDNAQNLVNWVGTLQGFFLDENGKFREDTNGNGLLDDYTVDRILEFDYSNAQNKTVVRRILSSSATDPAQVASTLTSDVEDINAIWKARDRLADLTDVQVATQRAYNASASVGRRIYTSVDGRNLLGFEPIDESLLSQLDLDEDALWSTLQDLNDDPASTANDWSIPTATANVAASVTTLQTHADTDVSSAVSALEGALPGVRANAEAAVVAAQSAFDVAVDAQGSASSNLAAANTALADATAADTAADTALAAATSAQASASAAVSTATTNLATAESNLTTATTSQSTANTNFTNASTALASATSAQSTAQSTFDTAQADVEAAESAESAAATAVTVATTTRDSAASSAASALASRDAAQTAANQAAADVTTATTDRDNALASYNTALSNYGSADTTYQAAYADYQDELAINPACTDNSCTAYADWQNAQTALSAAETARDDAQVVYNQSETSLSNAQTAASTANSTLSSAESALTTANSNLSDAEAALSSANATLGTAQSTLSNTVVDRDSAQTALGTANTDLSDAQSDLDSAQAALDSANQALTQATSDRNEAQASLAAAQATLATANTDLATATATAAGTQDALDTATADQASALAAYNAAVTNAQTEQQALNDANALLASVQATEDWLDDVKGLLADLSAALAVASTMPGLSELDRAGLLTDIANIIAALNAYLASMPGASSDPILSPLNSLLADLLADLTTTYNLLTNPDTTNNSLQEHLVDLDDQISRKEAAQGALVDLYEDLDPIAYLRYMDDNITGQADDPDLTYTQRNNVLRWVRGEEISGMRNRTVAFSSGQTPRVWRLPDIVHSTPVVVGRPSENYYSIYADDTYRYYMEQKFNRRQVVYVGSNGGMLHAFNAGFWDDAQRGYVTRLSSDSTSTQHPLGSELWAYVPKAALPHLQFVADPEYKHMALVDGSPQAFDVNIFTPSAKHPGGWGTILVVTMRLGGGPFTVRTDDDRDGLKEDFVVRPSVMVFDVTDPESEPELLAELSHPNMGFTLGRPTVVKYRRSASTGTSFANPAENKWLLVFGSGPTNLFSATSTQEARLFAYDLVAGDWNAEWTDNPELINLESNAYTGDIHGVDWNGDYIDDVLYFGVNTGTASAPDGRVARLRLRSDSTVNVWMGSSSVSTLIDVDRTVLARPSTQMDPDGSHWVSFGTGRMLIAGDNTSSQQQYLFGVMEPLDANYLMTFNAVSTATLQDVSSVEVDKDGNIINGPTGEDSVNELASYIKDSKSGWRVQLYASGSNPSGRNVVRPTQHLRALIYNEYKPSGDVCRPEGDTQFHAINIMTGTVFPDVYFGTYVGTDGKTYISQTLNVGRGQYGEGVIVNGKFVSHSSLGTAINKDVYFGVPSLRRQSWRQIFDFGF